MKNLLSVENLSVDFTTSRGESIRALNGVSFGLSAGEILGVVGESGAGKSLSGAAVVGLLPPNAKVVGGQILFKGRAIEGLDEKEYCKIRGKEIGFIFQDPLTSLNPLFTVGEQLVETIQRHLPLDKASAVRRAIELLTDTGISGASERLDQYPHQFSGGMRQRLVIALALAGDPGLVIADEPTTALDVSIQAQIMALLKKICKQRGTAILLITHDMGVIAETCDRVAVMYAGAVVELGPVDRVIHRGRHPYTQGLMACIPEMEGVRTKLAQIQGAMPRPGMRASGCAFAPRCKEASEQCKQHAPLMQTQEGSSVACFYPVQYALDKQDLPNLPNIDLNEAPTLEELKSEIQPDNDNCKVLVKVTHWSKVFDVSKPALARWISGQNRQYLHAVSDVSFEIKKGETFALVGESGCGKSTVAKTLVGLYPPTQGEFTFDGQDAKKLYLATQSLAIRKRVQMIFQDPFASLNPRWTVKDIVEEPLKELNSKVANPEQNHKVIALMESVGLRREDLNKYPHQFSGGQRQRISIARALATEPDFLICDEPTSALDVSVQAQVLNLMMDLQKKKNLTYLFISHNLAVVRHVSHRVGVMYLGRLVEVAPTHELFANPKHPYTKMLLDAIPRLVPKEVDRVTVLGEIPNPMNAPTGCAFHPRCSIANDRCLRDRPELKIYENVEVACHAY